ncbi:PaaI family thioesterase [Paenibacillus sp. JX-17]|uniref:Acyl-coenzyme A thioesterase THEM4 n=1 Tax=Paenibacillus lacisoli TaxID=3064525 RepID=A0ABT9C916_9BACL|nr:PaaI family thioesterase [Paenibacillus sp. JX-17]MDO7905749.1 PaaI family thioesterase [Paenibacillus sp. JX-17]
MDILHTMVEEGQERFWGYLGCRLISATEQEVKIGLTADEHHTNSMGIVHGGVLSSLMDQAMGMVATAAKKVDACVTTNLNVHYLSPMRKGELTVTAKVVHMAGRSLTAEAFVHDAAGTLGCMATGSFRVIKPPAQS